MSKFVPVSLPMILFVNLNLQIMAKGYTMSEKFLDMILHRLNPEYIFAHVSNPHNSEYQKRYQRAGGTSKLFLWNENVPNSIYVPCIPCGMKIPPKKVLLKSLPEITRHWHENNKNMQNKIAEHNADGEFNTSFVPSCGLVLLPFWTGGELSCILQTLGLKYNFTAKNEDAIGTRDHVILIFSSDLLLRATEFHFMHKFRSEVYDLVMTGYKFSVFTTLTSPMTNFAAFFSPFDVATWLLILLSSVAVTVPVYLQDKIWGKIRHKFFKHLFKIIVLLLNQVDGNVSKVFPLMTTWFFGCYILMSNLYGGKIFSYLTVTEIPSLPTSTNDLAQSGITLLTTSSYYARTVNGSTPYVEKSILKSSLIPEMLSNLGRTSKLAAVISKLNVKLWFIKDKLSYAQRRKLLGGVSPFHSGRGVQTYAVIEKPDFLTMVKESVEMLGKLFVPRRTHDTPFTIITLGDVRRNFFSEQFKSGIMKLKESGLLAKWEKSEELKAGLRSEKLLGKEMRSRFYAKKLAGRSKFDPFNEAKPISVYVLIAVFVVCLVFWVGAAFLWSYEIGWGVILNWVQRGVLSIRVGFVKGVIYLGKLIL
ncbi:hypothetical protein Fcan01_16734 [Folsomia candida]|uniref:Uncharacterized protein n=1 Tax=Folsomia candida TaxID=158441 RepID=A0A226DWT9_FOLCA|nr:hypothetical protein Fcan01_16734 [Folsomia candida]